MTALAADRSTPELANGGRNFHRQVAAATTIHAGSLVALNAAGYLVPGATATTLTADGRADERIDNSAGADGALSCPVRRGVFRFGNSASADLITIADIGASCYIVDDQTVAKTDGTSTRSVAGKVEDVDAGGVWVRI